MCCGTSTRKHITSAAVVSCCNVKEELQTHFDEFTSKWLGEGNAEEVRHHLVMNRPPQNCGDPYNINYTKR